MSCSLRAASAKTRVMQSVPPRGSGWVTARNMQLTVRRNTDYIIELDTARGPTRYREVVLTTSLVSSMLRAVTHRLPQGGTDYITPRGGTDYGTRKLDVARR